MRVKPSPKRSDRKLTLPEMRDPNYLFILHRPGDSGPFLCEQLEETLADSNLRLTVKCSDPFNKPFRVDRLYLVKDHEAPAI